MKKDEKIFIPLVRKMEFVKVEDVPPFLRQKILRKKKCKCAIVEIVPVFIQETNEEYFLCGDCWNFIDTDTKNIVLEKKPRIERKKMIFEMEGGTATIEQLRKFLKAMGYFVKNVKYADELYICLYERRGDDLVDVKYVIQGLYYAWNGRKFEKCMQCRNCGAFLLAKEIHMNNCQYCKDYR